MSVFELGRLYQEYVNKLDAIRLVRHARLTPGSPFEDSKLQTIRKYKLNARIKPNSTKKLIKPYSRLFDQI
jgi:hypothetical protein